jgi:hypothetical protein
LEVKLKLAHEVPWAKIEELNPNLFDSRSNRRRSIILHLMPSDHHRRPRIGPTIHKSQAPHVRIIPRDPNHLIRPENPPEHVIALHHEIDGRDGRSHSRTKNVLRWIARTEWLNRVRYGEVQSRGFANKQLSKGFEYGHLQ